MKTKTREIEVQILGKNFNFNVPESMKSETFLEIVDFVENRFRKIRRGAGDIDSFKLGLLVAINITEGFFYLKNENEKLKAVLTNIDRIISPVDQDKQLSISFSS
jgi:cell division protein ZapA (FtsZ GTPase activity inhibitor)